MGKDLHGRDLGKGLTQRKDGFYLARVTLDNGEKLQKTLKTVVDAKNWMARCEYNQCDTNMNRDMTVDEWYTFWYSTYKDGVVAASTSRNYEDRYKYSIKPIIGSSKLNSVKNIDCQKIINNMFACGKYSYGTIQLTRVTMHAIFKCAVQNGYINVNPADNIIMKRDAKNNEERRVLTREEQRLFVKYTNNYMYANAFNLVLETGLRCGEVGGLKWSDIDFDKKCLRVSRTLLQDTGKGGFYFGNPKTSSSVRTIPLTDRAVDLLNNQRKFQNKLKHKCTCWDDNWGDIVFTTINGKPVGNSTFRSSLCKIVNSMNDDGEDVDPIYMHALRHTFATRCIENGVQPKVLQKIMGHSTMGVTMDLYVHVTDDLKFSEMEKMNLEI